MAKIAAMLLLAGAFGYALWLYAARRAAPDATGKKGWRLGFALATAVFAVWLGVAVESAEPADGPRMTCYLPAPVEATPPRPRFSEAVRTAWLSLDAGQAETLRAALEREETQKGFEPGTARLLQIAFRETAYHYNRTRGRGIRTTCYDPTMEAVAMQNTREHLLARLELLAEAGRKARIEPDVYQRVTREIAADLAALGAADAVGLENYDNRTPEDHAQRIQVADAIRMRTVPVDAAAAAAATALASMAWQAPEGWAKEGQ